MSQIQQPTTVRGGSAERASRALRPPRVLRGLLAASLLAGAAPLPAQSASDEAGAPAEPALPVHWRAEIGRGATAPVLAAGERLYVATARQQVKAFEAASGRELWSRKLARGFQAAPRMAAGVLIVAAPRPEARAYGLDPSSGETRWERRVGDVTQPPLVGSDGVVFVSLGGNLRAVDPASGDLLWETRLEGVFPGGAHLSGDDLVVLSADGVLHRLDARTGGPLGRRDLGGPAVPGLVALADGRGFLVATGGGRVAAFAPDLEPLAIEFTSAPLRYPPALAAERAVLAGADRLLRGHALPGGELLWERGFPVALTGPPTVSPDGSRVAVGDLAGTVWTLDTAAGTPLSRTVTSGAAALPVWTDFGIAVVTENGPLLLLDDSPAVASPETPTDR